ISSSESLKGIYIFGVDSILEQNVSIVSSRIIDGSWNSINEEKYGVIIGDILAFQLGVNVGDMVNVLVPDTTLGLAGILPRTKRFKVTGIFSIGAPEMDQSFAYINITNAQKLLRMNNAVHGIRIRYKDLFQAPNLVKLDTVKVNQALNTYYSSSNWTNTYGTLFKAINMEKFLVFLLLSLVIVIAVFNIVSLSVMTINEKRSQIAILMTIGATQSFVQRIFMYFGSLIGLTGTLLGLLIGLLITYFLGPIVSFLESLLGIKFLEVYFINYFPVDFRLSWIAVICLTSLSLTVLASFYPSRLASKINPAEVLRHE
ncbi:MAG TPA: FtsX-like permease family protein, partial [Gammaproteobacteria bacterium]|nr:FtsX-like permease family protein [Gammaproteobacteria bacterium]